jgi:hypothetical protein
MFVSRHTLQEQIRSCSKAQVLSPLASVRFQMDLSIASLSAAQFHELPFVLFTI